MIGIKLNVDISKFRSGVEKALESVPRRAFGALNECVNEVSGEAKDLAPLKEGHLTESIRGEVGKDRDGNMIGIVYVPSNHQAASYAVKMHEGTYNLGPGSVAKQIRVGKTVGRKFITRALDNKRERLRKIIEYYFKEKN